MLLNNFIVVFGECEACVFVLLLGFNQFLSDSVELVLEFGDFSFLLSFDDVVLVFSVSQDFVVVQGGWDEFLRVVWAFKKTIETQLN